VQQQEDGSIGGPGFAKKILTPSIVALRQWVTIVAAWMGASALAGAGAAMGERSEKCDGKGGQRHLIEGARFAADSLRWWGRDSNPWSPVRGDNDFEITPLPQFPLPRETGSFVTGMNGSIPSPPPATAVTITGSSVEVSSQGYSVRPPFLFNEASAP
jgi:hypothetical protein